jgi:hypothetical protein
VRGCCGWFIRRPSGWPVLFFISAPLPRANTSLTNAGAVIQHQVLYPRIHACIRRGYVQWVCQHRAKRACPHSAYTTTLRKRSTKTSQTPRDPPSFSSVFHLSLWRDRSQRKLPIRTLSLWTDFGVLTSRTVRNDSRWCLAGSLTITWKVQVVI